MLNRKQGSLHHVQWLDWIFHDAMCLGKCVTGTRAGDCLVLLLHLYGYGVGDILTFDYRGRNERVVKADNSFDMA